MKTTIDLPDDGLRQVKPAIEVNSAPTVERHKTPLARYYLSKPVRSLLEYGLVKPTATFFDYGCGHGTDVNGLMRDAWFAQACPANIHPPGWSRNHEAGGGMNRCQSFNNASRWI
ncbi:MAG: hypothetical protein M1608_10045 [Candidatus Omnitrophica bacterium]|nr:hypothetical protein [Candidatus Omnitrophota bacterium]